MINCKIVEIVWVRAREITLKYKRARYTYTCTEKNLDCVSKKERNNKRER